MQILLIASVLVMLCAAAAIAGVTYYPKLRHLRLGGAKAAYKKAETARRGNFLINYGSYTMSTDEKIKYMLMAALLIFSTTYVLYRSPVFSLLVLPLAIIYPKMKTKDLIEKRKQELSLQFRDLLGSLSASLMSGKPIEGAFRSAERDLKIQYGDPDCMIIKEVQQIVRRLDVNDTIESAMSEFGQRSSLEDVKNFVDVFIVCKRTGGDLVQVIKSTTEIISDKLHMRQDIDNMLAQRRFEQKVLSVIPFGLIALLTASAKDFMEPIYTSFQGRLSMTLAVVLFAAAYKISKKLMNIEV